MNEVCCCPVKDTLISVYSILLWRNIPGSQGIRRGRPLPSLLHLPREEKRRGRGEEVRTQGG